MKDRQEQGLRWRTDGRHREGTSTLHGGRNQVLGWRDNGGPSRQTGEVVSRLGMIPFNRLGVGLTQDRTRLGPHLGQRVPVVGRTHPSRYLVDCSVEPLARGRITTTESPGTGSPWTTIHGFPTPDVAFVDGIQGHRSAKLIAGRAGARGGLSMLAAACRIQSSVVVRDPPKSFPKKPKADVPRADTMLAKALLIAMVCA